ncbi:MAG: DUF4345 domain-containing protein [Marinosulfonomonas sp.]|nr:DUF4345 domain-containing protein [Marinosulfonomonas sp.]
MTTNRTQKIVLSVSGLTATGIGFTLVTIPAAFYSTYGIELGGDPSLMSEIRAPGGALLAMGLFMLSGLIRPRFAGVSLSIGAGVFLSYGLSRCLSFALDGWPDSGLVLAAGFEILVGGFCLFALRPRRPAGEPGILPTIPQNRMPL